MEKARRCDNCKFWKKRDENSTDGFCKRSAPVPKIDSSSTSCFAVWPITNNVDWCGEFQLRRGYGRFRVIDIGGY